MRKAFYTQLQRTTSLFVIVAFIIGCHVAVYAGVFPKTTAKLPALQDQAPLSFSGVLKADTERIPILMYHDFSNKPTDWYDLSISPQQFEEEMLLLKALGYTPVHFKDVFDGYAGIKPLPKNPILITIDDGYTSNYTLVYPILKALNVKATIFVVGWAAGVSDYLPEGKTERVKLHHFSWAQAKEMQDNGLVDIQHHTYNLHQRRSLPLPMTSPLGTITGNGVLRYWNESLPFYVSRFTEDVNEGSSLIQKHVGKAADIFAYPYGYHDDVSEAILKAQGFKATLTITEGISNLKQSPYGLMRINAPSAPHSQDLIHKILSYQGQTATVQLNSYDRQERIQYLKQILGRVPQ